MNVATVARRVHLRPDCLDVLAHIGGAIGLSNLINAAMCVADRTLRKSRTRWTKSGRYTDTVNHTRAGPGRECDRLKSKAQGEPTRRRSDRVVYG